MTKNKYGARKTKAPDGNVFDSQKECRRYCELRILERAGKIANLRTQVKYPLIPTQRDENGKLIERETVYVADFVYFDYSLGREVVEDAKGVRTDVYRVKKKLMMWIHGIRITET